MRVVLTMGMLGSKPIRDVIGRKIKHQMATGHFVKFASGEDSSETDGREEDGG